MIQYKETLTVHPDYPLSQHHPLEEVLFFDIETTGLSASASLLYLIGVSYYQKGSWHITQWLNDDGDSEADIIKAFLQTLTPHTLLIHYNGNSFDIPYLKRKCTLYNLTFPNDNTTSLDLYKTITPYKQLLNLTSLTQKSIEQYLCHPRQDTYSGKDLIKVYFLYLKIKRAKDESLLLLHNKEDLLGMFRITALLAYQDLFTNNNYIITIITPPHHPVSPNTNTTNYAFNTGNTPASNPNYITKPDPNTAISITLQLTNPIPHPLTLAIPLTREQHQKTNPDTQAKQKTQDNQNIPYNQNTKATQDNQNTHNNQSENITLKVNSTAAQLTIPLTTDTLKHYYKNYKDYYYLPLEDTAIHKSVATYVDKEYRQKAKANTCYSKQTGIYLPQMKEIIQPSFKREYYDKISYLSSDILSQPDQQTAYISHLLTHMKNQPSNTSSPTKQ